MSQPSYGDASFEDLRAILARLRGPGGCPWDQEQTHSSLRHNLLEETYETLEALDRGDPAAIMDELGDLMVQVLFHCQIATEQGEFTYEDLFRHVRDKLVRRHPHVFGDATASTAQEVEEQWQAIKQAEGGRASALGNVPASTPALTRAQIISNRAARAGFEWEDMAGVHSKLKEELGELERAGDEAEREHEMGDVLFTVVNIARWSAIDAESALRTANQRFSSRFTHMEGACEERGTSLAHLPMTEKEALWQAAKEATDQNSHDDTGNPSA
jgi:MazG family protein